MNKINLSLSAAALTVLAALPLTGCKPQQPALTPEQQQQEIDRQVAQKVAEVKLEQQQSALDQKAQELAAREQQVAQKEQQPAQPVAAAPESAQPAPQGISAAERSTTDLRASRDSSGGDRVVRGVPADQDETAVRGIAVEDQVGGEPSGAYDRFYTALAPYGDWIETRRYGLVWQPSASADPGWKPYTAGRWAYTRNGDDEMGWTWISDEPFGWAAYHYGRWTRLVGAGWVWVPGTLWAPAWVSWRNSDDYVGWAPLPPETRVHVGISIGRAVDADCEIPAASYAFVPTVSFGNMDMRREVVPSVQNVTIVNKTVNVTNITVNNTVVVNRGPSLTVLAAKVSRPINFVTYVRKTDAAPQIAVRPANNVVVVPAAVIGRRTVPAHLPQIKRRMPEAVVERGVPAQVRTPGWGSARPVAPQPGVVHPVTPPVVHPVTPGAAHPALPAVAPVHPGAVPPVRTVIQPANTPIHSQPVPVATAAPAGEAPVRPAHPDFHPVRTGFSSKMLLKQPIGFCNVVGMAPFYPGVDCYWFKLIKAIANQ